MKRLLTVLGVLGVAALAMAARPSNEFQMLLRLNGSATKIGTIVSAGGSSTTNATTSTPFTIPAGETVQVYCDAAAFCLEGASASATITASTFGRPHAASTSVYWVFKGAAAVTFACAGAGAFNCAVWKME
jgi:hypothetical protein